MQKLRYLYCFLVVAIGLACGSGAAKAQVVVNEIMASNSVTAADEAGQFDDWVELYNNASFTVSLNGFYFTDDDTNLAKWAFPNVSIGGQGYLILWCDNDPNQGPLHTTFKLSALSEMAYLVNPLLQIVDGTAYSNQQKDISLGRFPNGVGPYVQMNPSFNGPNSAGLSTTVNPDTPVTLTTTLYPNPAADYVILNLNITNANQPVTVKLYNNAGQVVKQMKPGNITTTQTQILLPVEHLPEGLYVVELSSGNQTHTASLIIAR
ncbi:MAG TPA: lamin tail domain-containing protein [Chitinophagales bacterium]|nr:lamin tail domain-containing protein [Chitinophagales bacterium]HRK27133.1 lamin tail domain-containing protein [Chitinophagales bacterium]